jgi:hypothetical protein
MSKATATGRERVIGGLPTALLLVPVGVSLGVWLLPPNPAGLTGFIERTGVSLPGLVLISSWFACAAVLASGAFSRGRRAGRIPGLDHVGVDEFHIVACIVGAIGTGWIYWSVTGGSLDTLVSIWTQQDFTRFRSDFDYGVGISTGRYASVLAGGLSLARLFTGARLRLLDWASFFVLIATALLNSRISALMALSAAGAVILFSPGSRVRPLRIAAALVAVAVLFVLANYSRSASFYEAHGVQDPLHMAAMNTHSYLATPTQVTLAVSSAAMEGSAIPPQSPGGTLAPALPPYLTKAIGMPIPESTETDNIETFYQESVDLSISLTTNGALIDSLMTYGWGALVTALVVIAFAMWLAGRFTSSGPIGAVVGGVLLYALAETWRVFIFNAGSIHFVIFMGLAAAVFGSLRERAQLRSPTATARGSAGAP